ncbi:polypeptide VIA-like, cytochrome c oxidase [Diachasma alloeum]|uniref:Polypeptide VIA-like, cytochrome c oxidase n=2 Tax=Diachasma alloeum TaxID=454923 RepID=A0A4E0RT01_9HYME|nr:polypeptide VIA-like, cytochrome c oxidase [Diachasma alloeum]
MSRIPGVMRELEAKTRFWKCATLFGAIPGVLIMIVVTMINREKERQRPRPPYKPMEYMYRRTKRFPWGDGNHTLFHNPERNPVPPDGYEVPDPFESK